MYMKSMVLMKEGFGFAQSFLFVCLDINAEWSLLFFASSMKWVGNFLKFYLVQSFIGLINCQLLLTAAKFLFISFFFFFFFFFLSYKWGIYAISFEFIVSLGSIFTTGCLILYKKSPHQP